MGMVAIYSLLRKYIGITFVSIIFTIQTCTVVICREKKMMNLCENDGLSIIIVYMIKFYNRERDYFNLRNNYSSRIITFCNEDAIE